MSLDNLVTLEVVEGRDLIAKDKGGTSDPYVVLIVPCPPPNHNKTRKSKSQVVKKTLNPKWNFSHTELCTAEQIKEHGKDLKVKIEVWDWDRLSSDEFMGEVEVDLSVLANIKEGASLFEEWLELKPRKDKKDKVSGAVFVRFVFRDSRIPKDLQSKLEEELKLGGEQARKLYKEYQERNDPRPIKSPKEMWDVLDQADLLYPMFLASDPTSVGKERKLIDGILRDPEVKETLQEEWFRSFDADHSGTVDFKEMCLGLSALLTGTGEDKLKFSFNAIDTDGNGKLNLAELKQFYYARLRFLKACFCSGLASRMAVAKSAAERTYIRSVTTPIITAMDNAIKDDSLMQIYADMALKHRDKDKSGFVEFEEMVAFTKLSVPEIQEFIDERITLLNEHPKILALCQSEGDQNLRLVAMRVFVIA